MNVSLRLAIIGSRECKDATIVERAITAKRFKKTTQIVRIIADSGNGVAKLARNYAAKNSIELTVVNANWERFKEMAASQRNNEIAGQADYLIAIWDGQSPETIDMIEAMTYLGKPTFVYPWVR